MAYDLFFLSYNEPDADVKWEAFKTRFLHARRIDGVEGILNAHRECARRSMTSHFFVVDADNDLLDCFDPTFTVDQYEADYVHLWYARNPVNSLEYGWGGLKLFPKKLLRGASPMGIDMTTSFPLKVIPRTMSVTNFNKTPYDAWRSGFREAAKLSFLLRKGEDADARHRLDAWMHVGEEEENGTWAIRGAIEGNRYVEEEGDMMLINDWVWLSARFAQL